MSIQLSNRSAVNRYTYHWEIVISSATAGLKNNIKKKAHGLKAQPLKDFNLGSSPSVNRKLLTHILTNPPTHTQTSDLDDYNKFSHRLSLKIRALSSYELNTSINLLFDCN